jgi:acylphosphatase
VEDADKLRKSQRQPQVMQLHMHRSPAGLNAMPGASENKCVRVMVRGAVQGVGFRYFTRRVALDLGLAGYVRNMSDGSVEAVAEGDPAGVDDFIEIVGKGPPGSRVSGLKVTEVPPAGFARFEIRL